MRFFPAMLGALLITTAVFLFMQGLIKVQQNTGERLEVYQQVKMIREPPPPEQAPVPERTPDEPQQPEPQMQALALSPPTALPKPVLEVPALDLAVGEIEIDAVGDQFSAPLSGSGAGAATLDGKGQDAQGFIEVIPFATRKPNVPELAWRNKVSGWVLVAFHVTPQGHTRNVRILDASPRGVFEEKVVKAVEDWRYSVKSSGAVPKNLVVTQKVEVQWKDYPLNIDYLD